MTDENHGFLIRYREGDPRAPKAGDVVDVYELDGPLTFPVRLPHGGGSPQPAPPFEPHTWDAVWSAVESGSRRPVQKLYCPCEHQRTLAKIFATEHGYWVWIAPLRMPRTHREHDSPMPIFGPVSDSPRIDMTTCPGCRRPWGVAYCSHGIQLLKPRNTSFASRVVD